MNYLVDTNIWSEPTKLKPDLLVVAWLRENEGRLYVRAFAHTGVKVLNPFAE